MNEEERKRKFVEDIFPSPEVASRIVDIVVHNKPQGWSRKSNAPYYKEIYALRTKKHIDIMMETKKDLTYFYATWCGEKDEKMSKQTLYVMINQSLRYLIDKLDTPDRKYGRWYETVRLKIMHNVGIRISYIVGFGEGGEDVVLTIPDAEKPVWRQMENWLESDSNEPFCQEGLVLSPQEIRDIKEGLAFLPICNLV
jgi:hypothetical protein